MLTLLQRCIAGIQRTWVEVVAIIDVAYTTSGLTGIHRTHITVFTINGLAFTPRFRADIRCAGVSIITIGMICVIDTSKRLLTGIYRAIHTIVAIYSEVCAATR